MNTMTDNKNSVVLAFTQVALSAALTVTGGVVMHIGSKAHDLPLTALGVGTFVLMSAATFIATKELGDAQCSSPTQAPTPS